MSIETLTPDWPAPQRVHALLTTRQGGFSQAPFDSFNLARHVQDEPQAVTKNRQLLRKLLPAEPFWLNQIHSKKVVDARSAIAGCDADGSYTMQSSQVLVVMTADCLPLLLCDRKGTIVAAVHAGWRGLANGIVEQAIAQLCRASACSAQELLVWLGPAIGPLHFEVGDEVRQQFMAHSDCPQAVQNCFIASTENKYLADIYQLARLKLLALGVENISGGNYCSYSDTQKFFSYRRDGKTGRMASLIWLDSAS